MLTAFYAGQSHWVIKHSSVSVRVIAYTLSPLVLLGSVIFRIRPSKMKFL